MKNDQMLKMSSWFCLLAHNPNVLRSISDEEQNENTSLPKYDIVTMNEQLMANAK